MTLFDKNIESNITKEDKPMLVVFSGPSGSGKNSVIGELIRRYPDTYTFMPSITTRKMRPGEREGAPYHYVSREEFLTRVEAGEFYEYEEIHGNLYGISKRILGDMLTTGKILLKDVDVKGTVSLLRGLKERPPLTIFLTAGGREELRQRLIIRGEKDIELRLQRYDKEMEFAGNYDYVIVNDILDRAVSEAHERIINYK